MRAAALLLAAISVAAALNIVYDMPVSNHGARVRYVAYAKGIRDQLRFESPSNIGGLKSAEFLALNPQGKIPLLVAEDGNVLPESDTICRYLLETYSDRTPSFVPKDMNSRYLSETIVRFHDLYIAPIQGVGVSCFASAFLILSVACMYRAPGSIFSVYGTDRKAALTELLRQLKSIDSTVKTFREKRGVTGGSFLCGDVSLADATLFPTMVFCDFMLPQFFKLPRDRYMGATLSQWWEFMLLEPVAREVRGEMLEALVGWERSGRFAPIMQEMEKVSL